MIITGLLWLAVFFLMGTLFVLLRNIRDIRTLPIYSRFSDDLPLVSLCIPARNEEDVIARCVESALVQTYPKLEVLIMDDQSTDKTSMILKSFAGDYPGLKVFSSDERPEGWMGKQWACYQLYQRAEGDVLLFMDADTWMEPNAVSRLVAAMKEESLEALTVWPRQHFGSFSERIVLPLVYFALYTLLPARYVRRDPRWMPGFLRKRFRPVFAAACGQCLAFTKQAYEICGTHERVRQHVVEDVAFAKLLKSNNLPFSMFAGTGSVHCRMYRSSEQMFEGLRKNFLAGFDNNVPMFILSGLLHMGVFLLPPLALIWSVISLRLEILFPALLAVLITVIQRLLLDRKYGWKMRYGLLHSLGVLWFQRLACTVLLDRILGRSPTWKGRDVHTK